MFQQLLEELKKATQEVATKLNNKKELQKEVERLTEQNRTLVEAMENHVCEKEIVEVPVPVECDHSALEQEITNLKQQIADHVCPTCNHEEEIEVLKSQVASITAEKEELEKQHEENVLALQAEIEQLKKILATS